MTNSDQKIFRRQITLFEEAVKSLLNVRETKGHSVQGPTVQISFDWPHILSAGGIRCHISVPLDDVLAHMA